MWRTIEHFIMVFSFDLDLFFSLTLIADCILLTYCVKGFANLGIFCSGYAKEIVSRHLESEIKH